MASKSIALSLMRAALEAADPIKAMNHQIQIINGGLCIRGRPVIANLAAFERTYVFGAGKAACQMANAICSVGLDIHGGHVITKLNHANAADVAMCARHNIQVSEASHPIPCAAGEKSTQAILSKLREISSPSTMVIWLASGGGSALTGGLGVHPSLTLDALKEAMQWLLDSGAEIEQVNAIRKHLCGAHGGRIGLAAGKSTVLTLVVSDIIGSPLHAIAGGPTTSDPTTLDCCRQILGQLSKGKKLASPLHRAFFSENAKDLVTETPKTLPTNVLQGEIVVDLELAVLAAASSCRKQYPSIEVIILSSRMYGEAAEVGRFLARIGTDLVFKKPFVLLAGGETTVSMDSSKSGLGGRNQELALSAALALYSDEKVPNSLSLLSVGTDGTDGPTDAAGAVIDRNTINSQTASSARIALQNHDSYNWFKQYAGAAHVITGPTGTNVMDIMIVCNLADDEATQLL